MDPVVEFTMQSKTASRGSHVEGRSWLLTSGRRPTVFGDSMSVQAQIEIMTNPQEFTRLCNVVLIAEHGDDFLPIDDDRADRGNDGFLKSEQRMFAAHCFKRVQNRSLDAPIRAKMIGDLGKALALKAAEVCLWGTPGAGKSEPSALRSPAVSVAGVARVGVYWLDSPQT
jgi:hypothetical protein